MKSDREGPLHGFRARFACGCSQIQFLASAAKDFAGGKCQEGSADPGIVLLV